MFEKSVTAQFTSWIETAIANEHVKDYTISFSVSSDKTDGYAGDIVFAEVAGKTSDNEKKILHLVLKIGKKHETLRKQMPIREIYETEIYVYNEVFPAFAKFQVERKVKQLFDSVPKCYKTVLEEDAEVVIMENLKKQGYQLHDRLIPMNLNHVKFNLYNYAKFHAISFAMRDQKQEEFDKLVAGLPITLADIFLGDTVKGTYDIKVEKATEFLKELDVELAEKFKLTFEKGAANILREILDNVPEEHVIIHGDCWNNNFMFKYENGIEDNPSQVAMLDWQLTCNHSPVLDLAYFMYSTGSTEVYGQFEDLLRYYYEIFSEFLRELGSDPDELFPFAKLLEHWKKYSIYGVIITVGFLEMMVVDKEDAISFEDYKDGTDFAEVVANIKTNDVYKSRIYNLAKYYCNR